MSGSRNRRRKRRMGKRKTVGGQLMKMLVREFWIALVNIAVGVFTMILVLGEDVYWQLTFVDNIYTRLGTNPGDVFITLFVSEFIIIQGLGMLWASGFLGLMWKTLSRM